MRQPKRVFFVIAIGAIAIGMLLFNRGQRKSSASAPPASENAALAMGLSTPGPSSPESASSGAGAIVPRFATQADANVESNQLVRVGSQDVLATVNQNKIQLKDLLVEPPEDGKQVMTGEEFHSRLNRAIEMELTFQAAQAAGIGLTEEQQKRLNRVASLDKAAFEELKLEGISWSSTTPHQLEFEKRLMSALMLQQNLVAQEAAVAPSTDASVQARYEEVSRNLLARLKSNAKISLAPPPL